MQGEEALRGLAMRTLEASRADQTEVLVTAGERAVTRFANSAIHQNVQEIEIELRVRAVVNTRVGVAVTNRTDDRAAREVADQALEMARNAPEAPRFQGLPEPQVFQAVRAFAEATAAYTPEQRARDVKAVCGMAVAAGLDASGAWSTSQDELVVANSRGLFGYHRGTRASFKTVVMSANSSGYAERGGIDAASIDIEGAAGEAIDKATRSRDPQPLEPGEYPVVLEPYAVATMIDYLAYMGLGALAYQEGRSFVNEHLGKRVVAESISLWDDGPDPAGIPMPFDFEGVPKQRVPLIDRGTPVGVVYDSYTAARAERASTGHALPAPNRAGPFPLHLFLAAGTADRAQLLAGLRRGIWVTRFHYVNVVHPTRTILTGMTRDGTFLIEDGAVSRPIRNLRFTQGVLDALAAVEAVGRARMLIQDDFGGTCVPALRIGSFRFSSATEF